MSDGGRKPRGDGVNSRKILCIYRGLRALCLFAFPANTREGANHIRFQTVYLQIDLYVQLDAPV